MPIITLDHVSKRYRLSRLGSKSIREELARAARRLTLRGTQTEDDDEFYALRDVSFEIEAGETVGFIGSNGSGKSTILKLLAHITYPTRGNIAVRGSVASLIEVGAGFHPELTGSENIYLYGSIMGLRRSEVRAKFDRIVDFSELHRFIDTPVKRYSSGMYVRLGFAVAAHVNPQVLLVDEVLAVGDAAFKNKCMQRIEELRRSGMTIIFVSHDMAAVERLCERVFVLSQGRIRSVGEPRTAISDYYTAVVFNDATPLPSESVHLRQPTERVAEIVDVRILDARGRLTSTLRTGEPLVARIEYCAYRAVENPVFELSFYSADDQLLCHFSTDLSGEPLRLLPGRGALEMACDELGLTPGSFRIGAAIMQPGARDAYDHQPRLGLLNVVPGKAARGLFYSPHQWKLLPATEVRAAEPVNGRNH